MADRTVSQLERRLYVVFPDKSTAQRFLIDHRLPVHGKNLIVRPEILLGMTMTFEAPLHVHVRVLPRQRHEIHASMTRFASNAFVYMDTVIKVDEVGEIVHPIPSNRLILTQAGAYWFQHVAGCPDLLVTIHACCRWRDAGERTNLNRRMAIPAIDTDSPDMMLMAERNRLVLRNPFAGGIRRVNQRGPSPSHCPHHEYATENRQTRNGIRRSLEYLGHRSNISSRSPRSKPSSRNGAREFRKI
jgi:hypothetical protein